MEILYISTACSKNKYRSLEKMYNYDLHPSIENFHYEIMDGLVKNNQKVTSLSGYQIPFSTGKKIFSCKKEQENNIVFIYPFIINFPILRQIFTMVFFVLYVNYWILKNITNKKYIIIDSSYISISPFIVFIANLFNVHISGIVADVYDYMSFNINKEEKKSLFKLLLCSVNNYCWGSYDSFVFLTEEMNDLLNFSRKPYVVMEGIYSKFPGYSKTQSKNKKKIIMYSGSVYEKYGIKKLITAFQKIKDNNIYLYLYGPTDIAEYLKEVQKKDSRIVYFGTVSISEIRKYEKKAYILVNPRPTTDEYTKYSFPSKTLEYMGTGNIFITTKLRGIPKEYDEYVNYFTGETVDELSNDLSRLLDNKNRSQLLEKANKAKKFVEENKNNVQQSKKIIDLFSEKVDKANNSVNILITINFLLLLLGFFLNSIFLMKTSLIASFIYILIDTLSMYKTRLIFIIFLISFFIFSMGQYFFANVTQDFLYYDNFEDKYVLYTILIQYLSLVLTYYGFLLFYKYKIIKFKSIKINNQARIVFCKIVLALMIITFFFSILSVGERAIFSYKYGYLSLYNGMFSSVFPNYIYKLGLYYPIFFMFFIVFCDKRKLIYIAFTSYFIYSFLTLI